MLVHHGRADEQNDFLHSPEFDDTSDTCTHIVQTALYINYIESESDPATLTLRNASQSNTPIWKSNLPL